MPPRLLLLAALFATVAFPIAAQTQEGLYFSVNPGVLFAQPQTISASSTSAPVSFGTSPELFPQLPPPPPQPITRQAQTRVNFNTGFALNASLGYAFNFGLRLEGLFFHSTADISSFQSLDAADIVGPDRGTLSNLAGLLNFVYDIPTGSGFTPYINAGLGASSVRASNVPVVTTTPGIGVLGSSSNVLGTSLTTVNGSTLAFAYQLGAGLRYAVLPQLAVNIGYRFTGTSGFTLPDSLGTDSTFTSQNLHMVEAGVRWSF
jgi:opacity protein-like surface antigen